MDIDALIRKTPEGSLVTAGQIRATRARAHKADAT
jgi:hypothetical protein